MKFKVRMGAIGVMKERESMPFRHRGKEGFKADGFYYVSKISDWISPDGDGGPGVFNMDPDRPNYSKRKRWKAYRSYNNQGRRYNQRNKLGKWNNN